MVINTSVQYNCGFFPDIILLTQGYYYWGTWLNTCSGFVFIAYIMAGRPGSSEVPRNPLTRWDVSSIPANGIFLTKKLKNKIKMPNGWKTIKR